MELIKTVTQTCENNKKIDKLGALANQSKNTNSGKQKEFYKRKLGAGLATAIRQARADKKQQKDYIESYKKDSDLCRKLEPNRETLSRATIKELDIHREIYDELCEKRL